ncbi:hypothetical protein STXM2123_4071 [Streptomyces sp. F-3]|nr:hypothetical protein STXM2123_4071 [Streptomyces sp. F-3]
MLGHLGGVQAPLHPACVQPDQQAAQLVAQVHVYVNPSVRRSQGAKPTAGKPGVPQQGTVRPPPPDSPHRTARTRRRPAASEVPFRRPKETGRSVGGRRTGPRGGFHHNPL